MKNLKLILFFASTLILLLIFQNGMAQDPGAISPVQVPTLFQKMWVWIMSQGTGMMLGIIVGLIPKGWSLLLKAFAKRGALITKELGELMSDSSVLLGAVDKSIKEDGSIEQNSVKEVIAAGKEVIAELKDVTISIKPK